MPGNPARRYLARWAGGHTNLSQLPPEAQLAFPDPFPQEKVWGLDSLSEEDMI